MGINVKVRMSKIMCMPIKVGIRTYATYPIVEPCNVLLKLVNHWYKGIFENHDLPKCLNALVKD